MYLILSSGTPAVGSCRPSSLRAGDLDSGVPQGGIFSPLLFYVYINLLTLELLYPYHLYADDQQLYAQSKVEDILIPIQKVNKDLDTINVWSQIFGLTVNPTKYQAIVVGKHRLMSRVDTNTLSAVTFNGITILVCNSVKDLNFHLNCTLYLSTP